MNRYEYKAKRLEELTRSTEEARSYAERMSARRHEQMRDPIYRQRLRLIIVTSAAVVAGLIGAVLVGESTQSTTTDTKTSGALFWKSSETITTPVPTGTRVALLVFGILLLLIAVALAYFAIKAAARWAALKKYPAILTGVESLKVHQIAGITNQSTSKVYEDLQAMIEAGMIEDFYLDFQGEQIVSKKYVPKTSHKTVVTCSGCGGNNELIVGITRTCTYCGQPLVLTNQ